jgi:hypothetical protein
MTLLSQLQSIAILLLFGTISVNVSATPSSPVVLDALKIGNGEIAILTERAVIAYNGITLEPLRIAAKSKHDWFRGICDSPDGRLFILTGDYTTGGPFIYDPFLGLDWPSNRYASNSASSCAISSDNNRIILNRAGRGLIFNYSNNAIRYLGDLKKYPTETSPSAFIDGGKLFSHPTSRGHAITLFASYTSSGWKAVFVDMDLNSMVVASKVEAFFSLDPTERIDSGTFQDVSNFSWRATMNESKTRLAITARSSIYVNGEYWDRGRVRVAEYNIADGSLNLTQYVAGERFSSISSGYQGNDLVMFYQHGDGLLTRRILKTGVEKSIQLPRDQHGATPRIWRVIFSPFGDHDRVLLQSERSGSLVWNTTSASISYFKGLAVEEE